jgi:ribosomal protein S18 acetylase RimI-like enzyme
MFRKTFGLPKRSTQTVDRASRPDRCIKVEWRNRCAFGQKTKAYAPPHTYFVLNTTILCEDRLNEANSGGQGILIRPAQVTDAPGIARVRVISWRAAYRGIVAQAILDGLSVEETSALIETSIRRNAPGSCRLVAREPSGQIVGFALGGPERTRDPEFDGELYAIYLLPEFMRMGIGRRLLLAMAEGLHRRGMHAMLIWVLAQNPARRFYEALGGVYLREQPVAIGPQTLPEVAYGWPDLEGFIQSTQADPTA